MFNEREEVPATKAGIMCCTAHIVICMCSISHISVAEFRVVVCAYCYHASNHGTSQVADECIVDAYAARAWANTLLRTSKCTDASLVEVIGWSESFIVSVRAPHVIR